MDNKILKRNEVSENLTWNISDIYSSVEEWEEALLDLKSKVNDFVDSYKSYLNGVEVFKSALTDIDEILALLSRIDHFASLPSSVDAFDNNNVKMAKKAADIFTWVSAKISFFYSEIQNMPDEYFEQLSHEMPSYRGFIRKMKKHKNIMLKPEVEKVLAILNPVFSSPDNIYERTRICDMDFGNFYVGEKEYPLSFSLYEDKYMYSNDTNIRREAFTAFSKVLYNYRNTLAESYYSQIKYEKIMSELRGFDSVVDYLLYDQEVDRNYFDRQIDIIMRDLAPVMRKYARHLKEVRGLDEIRFSDLKIDLDPEYSKNVKIEEAKAYVFDAVKSLGNEYIDTIMKYEEERWVDFPQNLGKETGGFATMPFGVHPYVLMSWTDNLSSMYTLIHELGHCGQFIFTEKNRSFLDSEPSLYLVEAPSTFNELLFTDTLIRRALESGDLRLERYAISKLLSDTYFHNFVTHLLEAAYQRKVYALIDMGESFDADTLSSIKRRVLEDFWGDDVIIDKGAELTWMRQRHYYMGLYSYTYSAGLTIATKAFLNLKDRKKGAEDRWIQFLKSGGAYAPLEAAELAGVDISDEKPLKDTIEYLDKMCNRMIELTEWSDIQKYDSGM